jgi:hypothetical protein
LGAKNFRWSPRADKRAANQTLSGLAITALITPNSTNQPPEQRNRAKYAYNKNADYDPFTGGHDRDIQK